MIALEPELAALAALPRGARLLGFDLGTKTIGLALSDVERIVASRSTAIRPTIGFSAAVNRALIAADASRSRRNEVVDRAAAAYILQGALDRIAHARRSDPNTT